MAMDPSEQPESAAPAPQAGATDSAAPKAPVDNTDPEVPLGAGLDLADPNSPLAPLYLRLGHVVAIGIVLLFALYVRILPLGGRGLWAALALGRFTVENSQIPAAEPLLDSSDPDAPLPASGWLGRAVLYLFYRAGAGQVGNFAGGVEMLRFAHGALGVGLCFLAFAAYRRRADSVAWGCLGLALLIPVMPLVVGAINTQTFGLICFLGLLALFAKPELTWRSTVLASLLLALWANLDSSFVLGLAFLTLLLVGQVIESARSRRTVLLSAALAGSLLLVAFLTPDGPALFARLYRWWTHPGTADLTYLRPMDFSEWRAVHYLFLASLAALGLASAFARRALTPTELAVLLGFYVLTLWKQGAAAWWFLLFPWLMVPALAEVGKRFPTTPGVADLRKTVVAALLGLALLLMVLPTTWIRERKPRPLSDSLAPDVPWPVVVALRNPKSDLLPKLSARLDREYGGEFTGKILGFDEANDFFLFALGRKPPVLLFTDPGLFPERLWREYQAVHATRADWWELLDGHSVNLVVLSSNDGSKLATALAEDPAWEVVADGKPWFVAIRKEPLRPGRK